MDFLGIALQGLQQAQGQLQTAAERVVHIGLNAGDPPVDLVTLSDAAIALMSSKTQYETDLGVAHTGKEMEQATMSLLR